VGTRSNRLATSKQVIVWLALMYPLGVLIVFTVNACWKAWAKTQWGVELEYENEVFKTFVGTAIGLASMGLMLFCFERVGVALTRRRGVEEPPEPS